MVCPDCGIEDKDGHCPKCKKVLNHDSDDLVQNGIDEKKYKKLKIINEIGFSESAIIFFHTIILFLFPIISQIILFPIMCLAFNRCSIFFIFEPICFSMFLSLPFLIINYRIYKLMRSATKTHSDIELKKYYDNYIILVVYGVLLFLYTAFVFFFVK
ncbi:MAG: hypothetical protein IKJ43_02305 [Bacilli bacterium]|nr:hypothetical protein [Bacilli bacterium]